MDEPVLIKNRRSAIWNLFTPLKDRFARCTLCKQKFSFKSSISNLKKHLRTKHPSVHIPSNCNQSPNQGKSTISNITSKVSNRRATSTSKGHQSAEELKITSHPEQKKINSFANKEINACLLQLFTKDYQPFSIIEDEGFKNFVHALNPSYQIPDRRTISKTLIPSAYKECRERTEDLLSKAQTVCLTTDCWTSSSNDAFIAVTAHFINKEIKLKPLALECVLLNESPTSEDLANALQEIMADWSLDNRTTLIVSDNAENIKNAVEDLLDLRHFGCFAHTLNLVVESGVKLVTNHLGKVRSIVELFKQCAGANAKLMDYQRNNNLVPKKLVQDVVVRWNSTFLMLQRFVELKDAIKATAAILEKRSIDTLTFEEWTICEELCEVLGPFEAVTGIISGEKYTTASLPIPLIRGLFDICNELSKRTYTPQVEAVIAEITNQIKERFGSIETHEILSVCTFLDPRFKHMGFRDKSNGANARKLIEGHLEEIYRKHDLENHENPGSFTAISNVKLENGTLMVWESFDKSVAEFRRSSTQDFRGKVEIEQYLEEDFLPRSEDPLLWWKRNHHNYPNLFKIVEEIFCCVATSVPFERVFPKTGILLNDRRTRLSKNNVPCLSFLNSNS